MTSHETSCHTTFRCFFLHFELENGSEVPFKRGLMTNHSIKTKWFDKADKLKPTDIFAKSILTIISGFSFIKISDVILDQSSGSEVHLFTGLMTNRTLMIPMNISLLQLPIIWWCVWFRLLLILYFNGSEVHPQVGHQYGPIYMLIPVSNLTKIELSEFLNNELNKHSYLTFVFINCLLHTVYFLVSRERANIQAD